MDSEESGYANLAVHCHSTGLEAGAKKVGVEWLREVLLEGVSE